MYEARQNKEKVSRRINVSRMRNNNWCPIFHIYDINKTNNLRQNIIQKKLIFDEKSKYLDITQSDFKYTNIKSFIRIQNKAHHLYDQVDLVIETADPEKGTALFSPYMLGGGKIKVKPTQEEKDYYDRLIEVTHETQHAIDYFEKDDLSHKIETERDAYNWIISELRALAVQSAVSKELKNNNNKISSKHEKMQQEFELLYSSDGSGNIQKGNYLFDVIKSYMTVYFLKNIDDNEVEKFLEMNLKKISKALRMYTNLINNKNDKYNYITKTRIIEEESPEDENGIVEIIERQEKYKEQFQ